MTFDAMHLLMAVASYIKIHGWDHTAANVRINAYTLKNMMTTMSSLHIATELVNTPTDTQLTIPIIIREYFTSTKIVINPYTYLSRIVHKL